MKKLVIFDLDGTLLNTIADLGNSSNYALRQNHFPEHELSEYRFFVGNGINKLLERALPETKRTEETLQSVRKDFLWHYDQHNMDLTIPYPGIPTLLENLQTKGLQLAVASNKYHAATSKLIAHFFPTIHFTAVFGQRENVKIKPDPSVVDEIVALANVSKADTLYVGDSNVDMQTAINAAVPVCAVCWGFRSRTELEKYTPTYFAKKAEDILDYI